MLFRSNNWWTTTTTPRPAGDYRTSAAFNPAAPATPPVTSLNTAFAGVPANGTWTLRFRDGGSLDTGAISAANLTITAAPSAVQHVVDFDGNGKTDYAVVRNTGGGSGGQITWFKLFNGTGTNNEDKWGISTDFFVPNDYDGDGKTDVSVWRPGTQGVWYTLNSATGTVSVTNWGQTGDDPTVVGDYTGDGKADLAIYRAGAAAGQQSYWWYLASSGPLAGVQCQVPFGQNGDFPAPGDYNGDGKADFVVQRNAGGGQAAFWLGFGNGAGTYTSTSVVVWGTPTDVIVPGDYDGDGITDIATIRGSGGQIQWWIRPSTTGTPAVPTPIIWGASATDFPTQGDYDGDGKTDVAIWRPSATPGASAFWARGSNGGTTIGVAWGSNGDYPVANYNSH